MRSNILAVILLQVTTVHYHHDETHGMWSGVSAGREAPGPIARQNYRAPRATKTPVESEEVEREDVNKDKVTPAHLTTSRSIYSWRHASVKMLRVEV